MEFKSNAAKKEYSESITCGVCFDMYCWEKRPVSIGCGHSFCYECLQRLPEKICPIDRLTFNINTNNIPYNYDLLNLAMLFSKQTKSANHQTPSSNSSFSTSQVCRASEQPASSLPSTANVIVPQAPVYISFAPVVRPSAPPAPSENEVEQPPTRVPTSTKTASVRRITIVRSSENMSFGFSLKKIASKNWFILGQIEPDSPAYLAGLRNDDRLIELNCKKITTETTEMDVDKMIKKSKKEINLFIARNHGATFREPSRVVKDLNYRVLELKPGHTSFGFTVEKREDYFIISNVDSKSPAKKAGIKAGEVIREANGVEVTKASFDDFNEIIQRSDRTLVLGLQKHTK